MSKLKYNEILLIAALELKNSELAIRLLKNVVKVSIKHEGKTPFEIAKENEMHDVIPYIEALEENELLASLVTGVCCKEHMEKYGGDISSVITQAAVDNEKKLLKLGFNIQTMFH